MHGSSIGTDYDYTTDVIAVSKACIAGYSAVQACSYYSYGYITVQEKGKEDGDGEGGKKGGQKKREKVK